MDIRHGLLAEDELIWVLRKSSEWTGIEMETKPEDVLAEIHRLQAIELSKRVPS